MPRGKTDIVWGHTMRSVRRYTTTPYFHFSCECGVDYGRVSETVAQRRHNQHRAKFRKKT